MRLLRISDILYDAVDFGIKIFLFKVLRKVIKEFVLISFIKPDVHKTLNIINLCHVDNIIIKL